MCEIISYSLSRKRDLIMELFDTFFPEVRQCCEQMNVNGLSRTFTLNDKQAWPRSDKNHVILENDTAIDLGHPQTESVAFMLWTESMDKVNDGQITIIGPDLTEIKDKKAPFGKITLLHCHGIDEDNAYDRYAELDMVRYKLNINDYMLRALPQNMREWSRVSKKGLSSGFSFQNLGSALIQDYKQLEYVDAAEIIFITSSTEDIRRLKPIGEKTVRVIEAMNKIFENVDLDCASCDFKDICDEIDGLKEMHNKAR